MPVGAIMVENSRFGDERGERMPLHSGAASRHFRSIRLKRDDCVAAMPQLKIQDGAGLIDAEFNGSFVLQCVACQSNRVRALGPPTVPFPFCASCGNSDCILRQRLGVVFVNLIDRGNQIVSVHTWPALAAAPVSARA